MYLNVLYLAVFLNVASVEMYECPAANLIQPCECKGGSYGLEVLCEGALERQMRRPLEEVGKTNERVFYLTLNRVQLPNLPPNLLVGPDVHLLKVNDCNTSTVHENAFANVANKLQWLFITDNLLAEVPSRALQKLSNLQYLVLDDNKIENLQAEAFKGLRSLLDLSLCGNRIKFIHEAAFVGIESRLNELNLGRNELTAVPGRPLRNLRFLTTLQLQNNKITSLLPEHFDAMGGASLILLNLANNTIQSLPARVFRSLKKLVILNLYGNAIDAIHPLAFEGNEDTLELVNFRFNRLKEIPTASLKNLRRLSEMDLQDNSISKVRKDDFVPYGKNLLYIYLQRNSLQCVDPQTFVQLHVLRSLYLQSNQLNAASYETYSPVLDTIEFFDIHDNPLHCDCNVAWLADWINGTGARIVEFANETSCATPQEHAKKLLREIPSDQLVCGKSKPSDPCSSNTVTNHQERLSGGGFSTVLQLGLILLVTVVLEKDRLF